MGYISFQDLKGVFVSDSGNFLESLRRHCQLHRNFVGI